MKLLLEIAAGDDEWICGLWADAKTIDQLCGLPAPGASAPAGTREKTPGNAAAQLEGLLPVAAFSKKTFRGTQDRIPAGARKKKAVAGDGDSDVRRKRLGTIVLDGKMLV